eukprot:TRINITY_DN77813_c0_g1_i1.p1 TRINITY_DN77813_c0_g1~~TRINITY_DN77813_c0_g1_i1.p1  ORF type:complete len:217 (-),score=56.97 TRINITY_DN77813_c0_g1_i1:41-691(-)
MSNDAAYGRAVGRGALSFKGEDERRKKKRRITKTLPGQAKPETEEDKRVHAQDVPMQEGAGRISSSSVNVNGFETKFKDEVEVGDTICVHHPVSFDVEMRVVVGILSQRSLTLHQAFSKDLVSTLEYHIRKDSLKLKQHATAMVGDDTNPQELKDAASLELTRQLEKKLKKQRKEVVIREKSGMWGYKAVTRKLDKEATAEEMLDERCKQGRDKYC